MLDIFNQDPFTQASLTDAINLLPYVPNRIGAMGLFATKTPTTPVVFLERRGNTISLLTTRPQGGEDANKKPRNRRDVLPINVPHIPYIDSLLASDLSGLRQFDTEMQVVTAAQMLNDKLAGMRQDHEVTHEYFRLGAIKGIILDGDGSTELADLFDAFGLTQDTYTFDLEGDGTDLKQTCINVTRDIEEALGATPYDHIHAFCGNDFFDKLTTNEEVKKQYAPWVDRLFAINLQGTGTYGRGSNTVNWGGIVFENYRGKVGSVDFIDSDTAHFFPVGVPDLFREYYAPAQTMDDVNTPGRPLYAQQKPKDWNLGIDIRTESNPFMVCVRPKVLKKGTIGEPSA